MTQARVLALVVSFTAVACTLRSPENTATGAGVAPETVAPASPPSAPPSGGGEANDAGETNDAGATNDAGTDASPTDASPRSDASPDAPADAASDATTCAATTLVWAPETTAPDAYDSEIADGACLYRFASFTIPSTNTAPAKYLRLEKTDAPGDSCPTTTGFGPATGSTVPISRPIPPSVETHVLLAKGTGADLVLATVTQLHDPKYGFGFFTLALVDPTSGDTLKKAGLPAGDHQIFAIRATAAEASGDDVVVHAYLGPGLNPDVVFPGEIGSGPYLRLTYAGFFASGACKTDGSPPDTIERAATPL
jgi:hypothetical protein